MPNLLREKIEALLNRALLLDAQTHRRFCAHAGRRIRIELTDLEIDFVFSIHESGIELASPAEQPVDVTISGRIASLLGLLGRRDASSSLFPKDIQIRGDVHLAQELQTLLQGMEIDWEEYASRWIGDTAARKLCNLARANVRWWQETRLTLRDNLSEYLRFEVELLPDRLLVNEFNNGVDAVRDDTERLQQRIARLDKKLRREPG